MNTMYVPPRKPRRATERRPILVVLFVCLFIIACAAAVIYFKNFYPNHSHVKPDFGGLEKPVYYRGEIQKLSAIGTKEGLKLPLSVVKDLIDPNMIYEEKTESVIITTEDKVIRLKTNELTGTINAKPFELHVPIDKKGKTVYIPIEPLQRFYGLKLNEDAGTGVVTIHKAADVLQWAIVPKEADPEDTVSMRTKATVKAPIVADLKPGARVAIWGDTDGWYYVQADDGIVGYVRKGDVTLNGTETIPVPKAKKPFEAWKLIGQKINMTWEAVYSKNPDTSTIGSMPGLNVVSPTWFSLLDSKGNIKNNADPSYVKWAHARNMQVWALFSNSFEPKMTTKALSSFDSRFRMISQLLSFADMYDLQGINIDFENVYTSDKANLVQFVREMVPFMHEAGLVVSIDVTPKSNSEMWSAFLDRAAIGEVVDYMMLMAYDEHWAASPVAGSVSSLPWVENSIARLLDEDGVPASKLVLGMPYYTRLWTETSSDGKSKVKSKTLSMSSASKIIEEKKLKPVYSEETGQNYVEYTDAGAKQRIWLEDATSIQARVELAKKYDLAGVATWRRGFETANIWPVIQETLNKRP